MSAALLLFPLAAVAYFVWQATKSRIFLLGIPFLMIFRQSVFFEDVRVFWVPGRFSTVTMTMLWLIAVWAICAGVLLPGWRRSKQERQPLFGPRPLPEELVLVALAAVVAVGVLLTSLRHGDLTATLGEASGLVYMVVGYVLVRSIACHSTRAEVMRFIDAIVVVNTVAAALFVVHQGLHVRIYSSSELFQTVFQGQVITRSFSFMTPFLFLAIAVSFAKRRWTLLTYLIIAVNLAAVWVSYTRTMLAQAAAAAIIVVVARFFMAGQGGLALRRFVAIGVVVVSLAVIAVTVLPTESNFFVSRIQHALAGDSITSAGNLEVRNARLARTYELVARDDAVLGRGFLSPAQDPFYQTMVEWGWDSAWIAVLNRTGLLGAGVFAALFAAYAVRAVWLMRRDDAWSQDYGLLWFIYLVVMAIGSFIGWGFMDTTRYPMNLWFFAFVAAGALLPQVVAQPADEGARARDVARDAGRPASPLPSGGSTGE
jgi:hypothetical protein